VERRSVGSVYATSILLQAVGVGAAAIAPNVWFSLPCFVVAGIGNGIAVVCNSLLVQRGAPDAIRGRVFTVIMSVNYAVYGLGFVIAGPLTDSVGPRWVFGAVGIVLTLASLVAYLLSRATEASVELVDQVEAA
jgi:MFS family permease